jgi:hypothetical protein
MLVAGLVGITAWAPAWGATKAKPKPVVTEAAKTALEQMAQTLQGKEFSFNVRTLRVYADADGRYLHIGHRFKVVVRRPHRLRVDLDGDDGQKQVFYDGKTLVLYSVDKKAYIKLPVPDTIAGMFKEAGRVGFDFPLADLLDTAPAKLLLNGVTDARVVDEVKIDGVPSRHLTLFEPPGIEQELWLTKSDQALPERIFITFRSMPGQPTFYGEFSGWDFSAKPADADFVFTPPEGATQVDLKALASAPSGMAKTTKGAKP